MRPRAFLKSLFFSLRISRSLLLSALLCSFMSWWACLRASACSLNCSMSGTAPRVRPPCRFRNTFRSRAMPKALLNRKTGKQRPFFTALLLLQPACFGNREKRLQPLRQVVKQWPSFPAHAPRRGGRKPKPRAVERAKPPYVGLLVGAVEVFELGPVRDESQPIPAMLWVLQVSTERSP